MERWEAACIWLLLAIPTPHTDITACACAYFIQKYIYIFYCKVFHFMHLLCRNCIFQISKWLFRVWPVTGLRVYTSLSRHICGLKALHQLALTNEMQSRACCIMSEFPFQTLLTYKLEVSWSVQCFTNSLIKFPPGKKCSRELHYRCLFFERYCFS